MTIYFCSILLVLKGNMVHPELYSKQDDSKKTSFLFRFDLLGKSSTYIFTSTITKLKQPKKEFSLEN